MYKPDQDCLLKFPEMSEYFSEASIIDARSAGLYVFFEDYFNEFVEKFGKSDYFFQRVGAFIEELATSPNEGIRNLAEIGLIEGLINRRVNRVAAFLGEHSRNLLLEVSHRTKFNNEIWQLPV